MSLITCTDVSLSYENNVVLSELSFVVNSGDYVCVVGENGSGKSTLIKALLSLKSIASGTINMSDGLLRTEIGYLPQQTTAQKDFPASVWEIVLSGCQNSRGLRPFYSSKEKRTARLNMDKMAISDLKRASFRELSGGQQRRVLLARALCATKRLLLLDEPVSGLDPIITSDLYNLIKQINNEGITIIMVSHQIERAIRYASHILHLQNKPLFFGPTDKYIKSEVGNQFMGSDRNV